VCTGLTHTHTHTLGVSPWQPGSINIAAAATSSSSGGSTQAVDAAITGAVKEVLRVSPAPHHEMADCQERRPGRPSPTPHSLITWVVKRVSERLVKGIFAFQIRCHSVVVVFV